MLTKETAVFLAPAMLFIAYQQRWRHQGHFGVSGWLFATGLVATLYPLYARSKASCCRPARPWRSPSSVSIRAASTSRSSRRSSGRPRAAGAGLLNLDNQFWRLVRGDVAASGRRAPGARRRSPTVLNVLRGLRDRRAIAAGLLGGMMLLYLARGGVVFDFYVIAAISVPVP